MAKRKTGQAPADAPPRPLTPSEPLTYRQMRFVEEYARTGNATASALTAGYPAASACELGRRELGKVEIQEALAAWREQMQAALKITRENLIAVYLGMLIWQPGDFDAVLEDPADREAYRGLGIKAHAIKGISKSAKNGNSITFVDKKAVADGLWEKLGFDKDVSKKDRGAILGRLLGIVDEKLGSGSGSGGSDGSGAR